MNRRLKINLSVRIIIKNELKDELKKNQLQREMFYWLKRDENGN